MSSEMTVDAAPDPTVSPAGRETRWPPLRSPVLALLFLVLAFPTVLVQVYLTPPIQVADEENHFLRALQVADGHVFGRKIDGGNAGGYLDPAAPIFAHAFDALKFAPDVKLDLDTLRAAAGMQWGSGPVAPAAFPNTAIYPFFLYLPASAGIDAGRVLHLSLLDGFYLGRLATALASVALVALALALCGRGSSLLFVILCCPMTLSLFASVSQDAMAIALGALAAAAWSSYIERDLAMPAVVRAVVALALGAVAAARIPLFPLYILAIMPTRFSGGSRRRPQLVDAAAALAGIVPLAIGIYGAHAAKIAFRENDGVSPIGQLRWLAFHPAAAVGVAMRTLTENAWRHLHEFVGVLGWLDTDLPPRFYTWMGCCAVAALLIDTASSSRSAARLWHVLPITAVLLSAAGVFGAFYLAWTPVGASIVEGVQGRYFIVPAMVLAVSLPGSRHVDSTPHRALDRSRLALCAAVAALDLWVVPMTLLHRYYG